MSFRSFTALTFMADVFGATALATAAQATDVILPDATFSGGIRYFPFTVHFGAGTNANSATHSDSLGSVGASADLATQTVSAYGNDNGGGLIADARLNMIRGQIAARGKAISKAMSIVDQGLKCSLDKARGGELAERLDALYEYICGRLFEANAQSRTDCLDEAERLLNEIYGAWAEIGKAPANLKLVGGR